MNTTHRPASRRRKFLLLGFLIGIVPVALFFLRTGKHTFVVLPYYGERELIGPGDTLYHTVPPFAFLDQDSNLVTDQSTKDRILVVDFFFTTCRSICPRMSKEMQQLQFKLSDKAYNDVLFLSHTVDPEHDTPPVLKEYARKLEADTARWKFLTGDANTIYRQGNLGYLLSAMRDTSYRAKDPFDPYESDFALDTARAEQFVHSPNFVLVDKRKHIRGIYDGTRTSSVDSLASDIKMLIAEEKRRKREAAAAAAK